MQLPRQPSLFEALPSSQASPVSTTPSGQLAREQSLRQASGRVLELLLPSSHSSTPESTNPSPHEAFSQVFGQGSVLESLPSSQASWAW